MKQFFENKTNSPMYVSGTMVPPGEGMMVEVPGNPLQVTEAAPPTLGEAIALMLKKSVAECVKGLSELSDDGLEMMLVLESGAEKPRSTLIAALTQEQMARANAKIEAEQAAQRAEQLATAMTDLRLATEALDAEGDTDKHPALQAAVDEAKARVETLSPQAPV